MAKDFISDQEMIMLEKQGKVSYPDFIPDNEAESFFGGEQQKTPTQFSAELPKKPLSQRLGNVLGSILGGKVIGEYLGTKIAERSPEAQKLREVASELADRPLFEAPSGKQIAGDLVSIALNFVPFTKAGQAALATKTIVGQGTKKFVESASKKLAVNAAFGSAGGGAKAAAEDQNILSGAAIGGAIGGIPSAVGSTLKGIFTGKIAQRLQRELTRMGYGASKTQSRFDEVKANKGFETAAKKLQQKYGIGTSAGINQRIRDSLEQSGQQLDAVLSSSKKEFAAVQIKNLITKEIKKEFKGLLSNQEIKSLVNNLPLADLHRKQFINIQELNQLRKRFDSKYLTNSAWMRANPGEKLESYQTAYRVISGAIKKAEPSTYSKSADCRQ